jgi:N-acetyl-gamma-glutamylphosphate reductase
MAYKTDCHPSVYVAYPRIAQTDINDSSLGIIQMKMTDPKPDSFQLNLTQVITSHSSLHATVYAFNASVSLAGNPTFSSIYFPTVEPEGETIVNISQRVQLSNETAFADYSKAVFSNEQVQLNVYGTPELKEGSLPTTTVVYNKMVTVNGMQAWPPSKLMI